MQPPDNFWGSEKSPSFRYFSILWKKKTKECMYEHLLLHPTLTDVIFGDFGPCVWFQEENRLVFEIMWRLKRGYNLPWWTNVDIELSNVFIVDEFIKGQSERNHTSQSVIINQINNTACQAKCVHNAKETAGHRKDFLNWDNCFSIPSMIEKFWSFKVLIWQLSIDLYKSDETDRSDWCIWISIILCRLLAPSSCQKRNIALIFHCVIKHLLKLSKTETLLY